MHIRQHADLVLRYNFSETTDAPELPTAGVWSSKISGQLSWAKPSAGEELLTSYYTPPDESILFLEQGNQACCSLCNCPRNFAMFFRSSMFDSRSASSARSSFAARELHSPRIALSLSFSSTY